MLFALGGTLKERCDQWKDTPAVLPKIDAGKPLQFAHERPLPLDVDVDNNHFDPRCNVDFRAPSVRHMAALLVEMNGFR